jgi:hypothetical protein
MVRVSPSNQSGPLPSSPICWSICWPVGDEAKVSRSARTLKRIKRVGFGFRRFARYRIRTLPYAGRPNWDLINNVDPLRSDEPVIDAP